MINSNTYSTMYLLMILLFYGILSSGFYIESPPSENKYSINIVSKKPGDTPSKVDVRYGSHERQVMDFYKADSEKPTPVVIWIHGGGWVRGSKANVPHLEDYLAAGISVVSINYRYTWQAQLAGVEPPVKWSLNDAVRALQFVKSKAEKWNIDKERVGLSGSSAGGTSSLYVAFHDDFADPESDDPIAHESTLVCCVGVKHPQTSLDPQQIIDWTPNSKYGGHAFGFMDPNDLNTRDTHFKEFLENRESILKWINIYSPYALVSKGDPDIYLSYSTAPNIGKNQKDPTHTSNFGVRLQDKCHQHDVECELVYPGSKNMKHKDVSDFLINKLLYEANN